MKVGLVLLSVLLICCLIMMNIVNYGQFETYYYDEYGGEVLDFTPAINGAADFFHQIGSLFAPLVDDEVVPISYKVLYLWTFEVERLSDNETRLAYFLTAGDNKLNIYNESFPYYYFEIYMYQLPYHDSHILSLINSNYHYLEGTYQSHIFKSNIFTDPIIYLGPNNSVVGALSLTYENMYDSSYSYTIVNVELFDYSTIGSYDFIEIK